MNIYKKVGIAINPLQIWYIIQGWVSMLGIPEICLKNRETDKG